MRIVTATSGIVGVAEWIIDENISHFSFLYIR